MRRQVAIGKERLVKYQERENCVIVCGASAFTLIEVMMAMAIMGLVVTAIYTSWSAIVKGSKSGITAAAAAQRQRISMQMIEQALVSAQMFAENANLYSFLAESGSEGSLSFVSRLPDAFPRSGKFEGYNVRRVTFALEASQSSGYSAENDLVLRQNPILLEVDQDEMEHPIVLARNVKEFRVEFWEPRIGDWIDEWTTTNQLPKLVKVYLRLGTDSQKALRNSDEEVTRIVGLPSIGVQASWQSPSLPQGRGGSGTRTGAGGNPGADGNSGSRRGGTTR